MTYQVVYDEAGKILFSYSSDEALSDVETASIEVPEGKVLVSVDPVTKEPVFEDAPPSRDELAEQLEALKSQQTATNDAVLGLMSMMTIMG